jgi:small conductance mechanosensitive channel
MNIEIIKPAWEWLKETGPSILLILVITLIALKIVSILSMRLVRLMQKSPKADAEFQKRTDTLGTVIRHLFTVVVLGTAFIMLLGELDIEIGPILAAAGVVGLAVGFGAQNLVRDVINGFFILFEDQIRVGDVVLIAGKAGLVERVNLKMTILRDLEGKVHFVPNGQIDTVTNFTKGFSRHVFEIGIAYKEDVDQVIGLIQEVLDDLKGDEDFGTDIVQPGEIFGLDKFGDSALVIKGMIATKPIKQWRIGREFNRRIKIKFDEHNIEIPFPHRTIYMGQEKDGSAAPMFVKTQPDPDNQ